MRDYVIKWRRKKRRRGDGIVINQDEEREQVRRVEILWN